MILYMLHSVGKGPIWLFLEMETLRKIGEIVKKFKKKKRFSLFWCVMPLETPVYWQNTEKVTPRLFHAQFYMTIKGQFGRFLL